MKGCSKRKTQGGIRNRGPMLFEMQIFSVNSAESTSIHLTQKYTKAAYFDESSK